VLTVFALFAFTRSGRMICLSASCGLCLWGIGDGLTCEESVGKEGRPAATLRKMSDEKAYQLIEGIMEFNSKLRGLVVIRWAFVDPIPMEGSARIH
jgi:hypothetical protein